MQYYWYYLIKMINKINPYAIRIRMPRIVSTTTLNEAVRNIERGRSIAANRCQRSPKKTEMHREYPR